MSRGLLRGLPPVLRAYVDTYPQDSATVRPLLLATGLYQVPVAELRIAVIAAANTITGSGVQATRPGAVHGTDPSLRTAVLRIGGARLHVDQGDLALASKTPVHVGHRDGYWTLTYLTRMTARAASGRRLQDLHGPGLVRGRVRALLRGPTR